MALLQEDGYVILLNVLRNFYRLVSGFYVTTLESLVDYYGHINT